MTAWASPQQPANAVILRALLLCVHFCWQRTSQQFQWSQNPGTNGNTFFVDLIPRSSVSATRNRGSKRLARCIGLRGCVHMRGCVYTGMCTACASNFFVRCALGRDNSKPRDGYALCALALAPDESEKGEPCVSRCVGLRTCCCCAVLLCGVFRRSVRHTHVHIIIALYI